MPELPTPDQKDIHISKEEREIKLQLDRERFEELQFSVAARTPIKAIVNQRDIYYDFQDFRITNLSRGLRVRYDEGVPICLEFKSLFSNPYARSDNPWFVEEVAFNFPIRGASVEKFSQLLPRVLSPYTVVGSSEFDTPQALDTFLQTLGLSPVITVTKHRSEYESAEAVFTFDFIEELGYFIEVEARGGNDPISIIENTVQIPDLRIVREGYNDMMLRNNTRCLSYEEKQARFRANPRWNILPIESEHIQQLLRGGQ